MDTYSIDSLPCGALTHIASFLAVPSRALFAVAISTARNDNELTGADRLAIVATEWNHILDFGNIEEDLAAKLTEDHIKDILLCVDAGNRLNRLMLTGCINVTGAGLEPLRGSLVIEQIDFGSMETSTTPLNSVLPILDSIIEQERCALKHLEFPRVWRSREFPWATAFQQFILRYNQMWAQRQSQDELICFGCSARLPQSWGNGQWVYDVGGLWIQREGNQFGSDQHTCYGCLKHYCGHCGSENGGKMLEDNCDKCDRMYCSDCTQILQCGGCAKQNCSDCALSNFDICPDCGSLCCHSCSCDECGFFCFNCNTNEDEWPDRCEECHETLCGTCRSQSRSKGIELCNREYCHLDNWCNGCRENRILRDGGGCNEECCCHNAVPALQERFVELTSRIEELTNTNEELASRNGELANRIEDLANRNAELTSDNNQLRGKIKSLRKFEGMSDHDGHKHD